MKVALVHDWMVSYRGGEKILEALCELFPEAPIFTLFYDPFKLPKSLRKKNIFYHPLVQPLSFFRKALLPFYPVLIESFNLSEFDLVISTSSCVAKGVMTAPSAKHICYIHSPMRYIWDQKEIYFGGIPRALRFFAECLASRLRVWDVISSNRVDHFIANSSFVKERVEKYYRRQADVVHPFVEDRFFISEPVVKENYYLVAGALVPYKRFDLAIAVCKKLNVNLMVAGQGPLEKSFRTSLNYKAVELISPCSDNELSELMQKAKALIFPGVEDFGIIAIEAMASGTPVIAYKKGGALDFIQEGINGIFFEESNLESLTEAIQSFEKKNFDFHTVQNSVSKFRKTHFLEKIKTILRSEAIDL